MTQECELETFAYDAQGRLVRADRPDGVKTFLYSSNDRLQAVLDNGIRFTYEHDDAGRVINMTRGDAGGVACRYDSQGRLIEGRTSAISTRQEFDEKGRLRVVRQVRNGVSIELGFHYDAEGRVVRMDQPGCSVLYEWDGHGRVVRVRIGTLAQVEFEYWEDKHTTALAFSNGMRECWKADPADTRLLWRELSKEGVVLDHRDYTYGTDTRLASDGIREYEYDANGRLTTAREGSRQWSYEYDPLDNRLNAAARPDWSYRTDSAGQLVEARFRCEAAARFEYDWKGRLAVKETPHTVERYLYSPAGDLAAVTDGEGRPLRCYVRGPFGCLAVVAGSAVYFLHNDERGSCRFASGAASGILRHFDYDPFGVPFEASSAGDASLLPVFAGHVLDAATGLYSMGARWYDPYAGRFLTADAYTGQPDDARLVNPWLPSGEQARLRAFCLPEWRKQPGIRNRYAYCGNDPVNRVDPSGHWHVGWLLLSLLGVVWSLPNTVVGLAIEATCIAVEVIRWIVSLFGASWAGLGIDVAGSSRQNMFALVFRGGWIGSSKGMLGVPFGNVFFVNGDWENNFVIKEGGDVKPAAYHGAVTFNRRDAFYEHMLRHTFQSMCLGPFFWFLPVPPLGFFMWDRITGQLDRAQAWVERDAREYGGL